MKKLTIFLFSLFLMPSVYALDVAKIANVACPASVDGVTRVTANIGPATLDACIGMCFAKGPRCEGGTHDGGVKGSCRLKSFNINSGAPREFQISDCNANPGATTFFVP